MRDFDRGFDRSERRMDRFMGLVITLWVFAAVLGLGLVITGAIIAWHFIQKVW
jgi:hypothetical protein